VNAKRPPRRRCASCGGDYYAWQESGICLRCRRGHAGDGVGELARANRLARGVAIAKERSGPRLDSHGFPEGF
jgi:hypothetical protein